ncbi:MAG: response regulator [Elusimicrobia bacterium]|nr:response regulator [Elusimicrobiota bacterium]
MTKIMIVEDDQTTVKLLTYLLEKKNYKVVCFPNGQRAVEEASKEMPDLILMDIMMPIMDGIEATEKIKSDEKTSSIPIIFLSALGQEMEVMKGLQSGADGYVIKPFDSKALLKLIEDKINSAS